MCYRRVLVVLLMLSFLSVTLQPVYSEAHWDMEPRFWADESKEKFFFRIHNGSHANRNPVKKELSVCFWIEELHSNDYAVISDKKCTMVVIKPDEWMTFDFELKDVDIRAETKNNKKLKRGNYRAAAMAREQKSKLEKLFFGASMERLYSYFEIK